MNHHFTQSLDEDHSVMMRPRRGPIFQTTLKQLIAWAYLGNILKYFIETVVLLLAVLLSTNGIMSHIAHNQI